MFKSKTLFIVGAGASAEVKMPVGNQLKNMIATMVNFHFTRGAGHAPTSGDQAVYQALREYAKEIDRPDMNVFVGKGRQMAQALPTTAASIDNYLFNHAGDSDTETIGKLAIAQAILNAEAKSTLAEPGGNVFFDFDQAQVADTWFMWAAQMMIDRRRRDDIANIFDNVDFITFNYDRTIERFFPQVLGRHYGVDQSTIYKSLLNRTIVHPYGSVGPLGGLAHLGYGDTRPESLLAISKRLRTFDEGMANDEVQNQMRRLVVEAETIIFLGFAYYEQNMRLLNPHGQCAVKRIYGTTAGLSASADRAARLDISRMTGANLNMIDTYLAPMHANKLLFENQRILTDPVSPI